MTNHYFYDTICQLRVNEEIILYDKVLDFEQEDIVLVRDFLSLEFDVESFNYPFGQVKFDSNAALWGAKTIYTASQILLYREHKDSELTNLLPGYIGEMSAEAIFSADLCLRFLPQILEEAKLLDFEDSLIPILQKILTDWHYSGIGVEINNENLKFDSIFTNPSLEQMYADRIIERRDAERAALPQINEKIKAIMGIYSDNYWKK